MERGKIVKWRVKSTDGNRGCNITGRSRGKRRREQRSSSRGRSRGKRRSAGAEWLSWRRRVCRSGTVGASADAVFELEMQRYRRFEGKLVLRRITVTTESSLKS